MRLLLAVSMLAVLMSAGCGARGGFLRDSTSLNDFQYKMDITSVAFKRTVAGTANIGLVLCAIPISGDYYKRAMEDLHQRASLNTNEVLTNFREDHAITTFLGFYCIQEVTISADVMVLGSASPPPPPPAPAAP